MENNSTVKNQPDGYYYFPRSKQFPYKTKNLRDPYIKQIIADIKTNHPDVAHGLLEHFGYVIVMMVVITQKFQKLSVY